MSRYAFSLRECAEIARKTSTEPVQEIGKFLYEKGWIQTERVGGKTWIIVSTPALMQLWNLKSPAPVESRLEHLANKKHLAKVRPLPNLKAA